MNSESGSPNPPQARRIITIDPVTRLEGHAKITIHLDEEEKVAQARFHITEFRGFEKFCEGRPLWEMPGITGRICGICPVSHLLASSKAGDAILAVDPPVTAVKLRRLINLGQIIQSHALSFFHLSAPDLLLGMESDPSKRNIFGLIASDPETARDGIRLRQFGQQIIERVAGRKIHPAWAVPGGVRDPLSETNRQFLLDQLPAIRRIIDAALNTFKRLLDQYREEAECFGNFPSLFLGLVGRDGGWEHYDGCIRIVDSEGTVVADQLDPADYRQFIGEAVEAWSYLKFPYYKEKGYPDGMYRVGPLARLNLCHHMGTEAADREWQSYRDRHGGKPIVSSFFYHYARLIEILAGIEQVEQILEHPEITSTRVRAQAGVNRLAGVGASEAPRGTLFHDYQVDEDGLITKMNLIIATGQNNLAMNQTVLQIARHYLDGQKITEGLLNRIEAGVRAYDPCLSCSTHAYGKMPLKVTLHDVTGALLAEKTR